MEPLEQTSTAHTGLTADADDLIAGDEAKWRWAAITVLIVGALLRLYDLALVPLHHDEAVNGSFLKRLIREGSYQYDPENYHGPTLYYFSALIPWVSGLLFGKPFQDTFGFSTVTIRVVPAAFGIATICLLLSLRRRIGWFGALLAATLIAVSPGAVYLSRYFIHETLFVFFTLSLVVTALLFYESGRSLYLMLAAACAALMFATKETAFISLGSLLISALGVGVLRRGGEPHESQGLKIIEHNTLRARVRLREIIAKFGGLSSLAILLIAAVSLFLTINLLFFTAFFSNYPKGVYDALRTFQFWTRTGTSTHVQPWYTYLAWMWRRETAILLFGAAGAGLELWSRRNTFALFVALWALLILAAYSAIPYKTPWLMLNFVVPLSITAGFAVQRMFRWASQASRAILIWSLGVVVFGASIYQTVALNFFHYDDPGYVYVYAHTVREFLPLVEQIESVTKRAGTGEQTGITVTSPEYWPLPWYLRNYPRVTYPGRVTSSNDPIIVGLGAQEPELRARLGEGYVMIKSNSRPSGVFPLRPKIDLVLFVRKDLAPY